MLSLSLSVTISVRYTVEGKGKEKESVALIGHHGIRASKGRVGVQQWEIDKRERNFVTLF